MAPLVEIYCFIDDFCKYFELVEKQKCLPNLNRQRYRPCTLSLSEIMTIVVLFQRQLWIRMEIKDVVK